uniref:Uncharacterized protein n=1 Tax=Otus sunia TaxID=257818 RepID=A0A8C8ABW7_9STRI
HLQSGRHPRLQRELLRNHAAYLGYAVSSLRLPRGRRLYVAGAPRFQHKGKVILFELDTAGTVTVAQALTGEQIGSYFGSEVCALDVDSDGGDGAGLPL